MCQIILVCSLSSKHFTYIVSPFENTRPTLLESRSRFDDVLSILQANITRIPRFSRREGCSNKRLTDLLLYSQSKESNHPNRVIRSLFDREPLLSRNIARPTRAIYKNYSSMSKARPHLLHSSLLATVAPLPSCPSSPSSIQPACQHRQHNSTRTCNHRIRAFFGEIKICRLRPVCK